MALVHDDLLWLGECIPIDMDLIQRINGFPYSGADPIEEFGGKAREKVVANKIKKKYDVLCKSRGFVIE